jgi:hypothetical protein
MALPILAAQAAIGVLRMAATKGAQAAVKKHGRELYNAAIATAKEAGKKGDQVRQALNRLATKSSDSANKLPAPIKQIISKETATAANRAKLPKPIRDSLIKRGESAPSPKIKADSAEARKVKPRIKLKPDVKPSVAEKPKPKPRIKLKPTAEQKITVKPSDRVTPLDARKPSILSRMAPAARVATRFAGPVGLAAGAISALSALPDSVKKSGKTGGGQMDRGKKKRTSSATATQQSNKTPSTPSTPKTPSTSTRQGEPRSIAEAKRMGKNYFIDKNGKRKAAVTAEELKASGMSLRDYLNKQQGKTRRSN